MKNTNQFQKCLVRSTLALAVAALAWLPGTVRAQDSMPPMKGGEHMRMLSNIDTQAQAEELKPGDEVTMVCAKCKTVATQYIKVEDKGHTTLLMPGTKHLCPSCNGTIEVVGTGKGKHDALKHVCSMCGSDSTFCCATTTASESTPGMEKK